MIPLLGIRQLSVQLWNQTHWLPILHEVSLSLFAGECVALIGGSGSGKSVTAQCIIRLINKCQTTGQLLFQGEELLTKTEKEMQRLRGKKIGWIAQNPGSALNPTRCIGYQVGEGLCHHERISQAAARPRVLAWLTRVGLADAEALYYKYPFQLSGGMQQRVAIAMVLICQPTLLIADEITTALDPTLQAQILDLLQQIQREEGTTILLITHDIGLVARYCDRAYVMQAGAIVEEASVDALFAQPRHPYTCQLIKEAQNWNQRI